jgi:hypothetical protein
MMSDTIHLLQLPGAQLESIVQGDDTITLHFSQVHLVQEMEGAVDDSLWTQAVNLIISGIEITGELPDCPCELKGGDMTDNIYTYRDHAPLPMNWRGEVRCKLTAAGSTAPFTIDGESMQLEQIDFPCYVKHISKIQGSSD